MILKNKINKDRKNWREIFESFDSQWKLKNYDLKGLLYTAGHLKSKTGGYTVKKWLSEMKKIKDKIAVKNGKILEIGCGTGAVLKTFEKEMKIFGADYGKSLIKIASKALPGGHFQYSDAANINYKQNYFDSIIIFSCAQFFPDKSYFNKVINKCFKFLKKDGNLFIGDLIEKSKQKEFDKYRKNQLGLKEYKLKYQGKENSNLTHFSIDRDEISSLLKSKFKNIEIFNSIIRGDENEVFRFNVFCKKK